MSHRIIMTPLAALALLCACASAEAQTNLRFKFVKGQTNSYDMTQEMSIAQMIAGKNIDMEMKQSIEFSQTVDEVLADGSAKVTTKFTRARMSMKGPLEVDLDSANENAANDNPGAAILGGLVKTLGKIQFTAVMKTTGELSDVKVPEDLVKELRNLPGSAQMGDMFSEQGLKQMMSQGSITFPKEPVKVGESWNQSTSVKLPFGKMTGDMKLTYQGTEKVGDKTLAKIGVVTKAAFADDEKAQITMKITSQKADGHFLFDAEAGRLQESTLNQTMEMSVGVLGQTIDQNLTQKVNVKLRK
jgi:hypothetical protein